MQVASLLGHTPAQSLDLISLARKGVSKQEMLAVQKRMQLSQKEISQLLHLTPRTIQRMEAEDLLPPAASGQLVELARIFGRSIEVLGEETKACQWLRTPLAALNQSAPLNLLDTPVGIQWVFNILGRIEYGIYS